jgi:hypothetical protein
MRRNVKLILIIFASIIAVIALAAGVLSQRILTNIKQTAAQVSQSCAYSTQDTDGGTIIVVGTGPTCNTLGSGLAQDGNYWAPFTGNDPVSNPVCSLDAGNSTITVYSMTVAYPLEDVAGSVCSSEEANGWTAEPQ